MPDMSWLDDVFPGEQKWNNIRDSFMQIKNMLPDKIGKYENIRIYKHVKT